MSDSEPLARRVFRYPMTGHEVALLVDHRGTSGGPREFLWRVWLEDAPGRPPGVAALRFLSVHGKRCSPTLDRRGRKAGGKRCIEPAGRLH
jgi:hypothetical protein